MSAPRVSVVALPLTIRADPDKHYLDMKPNWILSVVNTLIQDESKDVRAFVAAILQPQPATPTLDGAYGSEYHSMTTSAHHTFSRPPPPSTADSIEVEILSVGIKPTQNGDGPNHTGVSPSPKSSLSTLKNGYDHETKAATSKTKDGVLARPGLSPRTKNGRVSR